MLFPAVMLLEASLADLICLVATWRPALDFLLDHDNSFLSRIYLFTYLLNVPKTNYIIIIITIIMFQFVRSAIYMNSLWSRHFPHSMLPKTPSHLQHFLKPPSLSSYIICFRFHSSSLCSRSSVHSFKRGTSYTFSILISHHFSEFTTFSSLFWYSSVAPLYSG